MSGPEAGGRTRCAAGVTANAKMAELGDLEGLDATPPVNIHLATGQTGLRLADVKGTEDLGLARHAPRSDATVLPHS